MEVICSKSNSDKAEIAKHFFSAPKSMFLPLHIEITITFSTGNKFRRTGEEFHSCPISILLPQIQGSVTELQY